MGLSTLLVDTYRRYKRDTKAFAQWLGTAARSTGLVEHIFEDDCEPRVSNPARRRNRKNRKPRKQSKEYKIPVDSLIELAEAIRETDNSKVPRNIMNTLSDVIQSRKICAAWYRAQQTMESATAISHNDGHQHIIEVLEQVRGVIAPLQEDIKPDYAPNEPKATPSTNLFSLLEVEECPEWNDDAPAPTVTKKVPEVSYEQEASPEDVSFALFCFMKDLTDIRIFIRRTWREYKHRQVTLNTAATTVNTAIDVMRRLNEEFTQTFPQFSEHPSVIE